MNRLLIRCSELPPDFIIVSEHGQDNVLGLIDFELSRIFDWSWDMVANTSSYNEVSSYFYRS